MALLTPVLADELLDAEAPATICAAVGAAAGILSCHMRDKGYHFENCHDTVYSTE